MPPDDKPNTPMTPREYVELIVRPTLDEFLDDPGDRRRAYLACVVIYHCVDSLGLAEAARAPGFAALSKTARADAVKAATAVVRAEMERRCGSVFSIVRNIANGTKHPGKLPLVPGTERDALTFKLDDPNVGWEGTRWGGPGLALDFGGKALCLDECAQQVLAAFVCAYPTHLQGVDLSFLDLIQPIPGLAMEDTWLGEIRSWAEAQVEVAEVWLFGSRAKGTERPDSDVDLGLVLMPSDRGHDWALGNWSAVGTTWREKLQAIIGRHVSLEAFSRRGEEQSEEEVTARTAAILLWKRPR